MRQSLSTWKLRVGPAVAVMALLALTVPGMAPGSSDPCTQTLSNPGTSIGSSVPQRDLWNRAATTRSRVAKGTTSCVASEETTI